MSGADRFSASARPRPTWPPPAISTSSAFLRPPSRHLVSCLRTTVPVLDTSPPGWSIDGPPHGPATAGGIAMPDAIDLLLSILDLEPLEHNLFRGTQPDSRLAAGLRRPGHRPGAGRRRAHRRGPRRPFAARLFHAAGRPQGPHPLRGRPHPRRPQLHHPPGRRHPARPGDLLHVGLLPGRGGRARPPDRHARRAAAGGPAERERHLQPLSGRRARNRCAATGSASGRSSSARSISATIVGRETLEPGPARVDPDHRQAARRPGRSTAACSPTPPT